MRSSYEMMGNPNPIKIFRGPDIKGENQGHLIWMKVKELHRKSSNVKCGWIMKNKKTKEDEYYNAQ